MYFQFPVVMFPLFVLWYPSVLQAHVLSPLIIWLFLSRPTGLKLQGATCGNNKLSLSASISTELPLTQLRWLKQMSAEKRNMVSMSRARFHVYLSTYLVLFA